MSTLAQLLTEISARHDVARREELDAALNNDSGHYRGKGTSGDSHVVYAERGLTICQNESAEERLPDTAEVTCTFCRTWLYG
jgi:hypothetical protein